MPDLAGSRESALWCSADAPPLLSGCKVPPGLHMSPRRQAAGRRRWQLACVWWGPAPPAPVVAAVGERPLGAFDAAGGAHAIGGAGDGARRAQQALGEPSGGRVRPHRAYVAVVRPLAIRELASRAACGRQAMRPQAVSYARASQQRPRAQGSSGGVGAPAAMADALLGRPTAVPRVLPRCQGSQSSTVPPRLQRRHTDAQRCTHATLPPHVRHTPCPSPWRAAAGGPFLRRRGAGGAGPALGGAT